MADAVCFKNIINHYSNYYPKDIQMLSRILRDRNYLPEFCSLAMKVDLENESNKKKINKMIKTLVNCNFIVRMFQAVEGKHIFYLTFELSQQDIEKYA